MVGIFPGIFCNFLTFMLLFTDSAGMTNFFNFDVRLLVYICKNCHRDRAQLLIQKERVKHLFNKNK